MTLHPADFGGRYLDLSKLLKQSEVSLEQSQIIVHLKCHYDVDMVIFFQGWCPRYFEQNVANLNLSVLPSRDGN